jgi:hypothetical protein
MINKLIIAVLLACSTITFIHAWPVDDPVIVYDTGGRSTQNPIYDSQVVHGDEGAVNRRSPRVRKNSMINESPYRKSYKRGNYSTDSKKDR